MSFSSALALPTWGGRVSPCGCLLAGSQPAVPSQGNRCPNAAGSPAALLGGSSSSHHVCLPGLLCMTLPRGGYVCFPSEEGRVQGQPEKANDLLVQRWQQRWATESRESYTQSPFCADRCGCPGMWQGRGEAVSVFNGALETGWLCGRTHFCAKHL